MTQTKLLLSSLMVSGASAFVSSSHSSIERHETALHLLPSQGSQLKAAVDAASCKKTDEKPVVEVEKVQEEDQINPARAFVSRVFSMPSSMIKRHPHPKDEGWMTDDPVRFRGRMKKQDDVVLYPVVGFQFVRHGDSFVPLPTKSHAACRLPLNRNEEVYGWFSPVCKLDIYSEDPCHAPEMN